MSALHQLINGTGAMLVGMTQVALLPLVVAVGLQLGNLALRSAAWRRTLAVAHPHVRIPYRTVLGAYCAGVGVNALAPARGGEVVKVAAIRTKIPGTSAASAASSLLVEALLDGIVVAGLLFWAVSTGAVPLPPAPPIPSPAALVAASSPLAVAAVTIALLLAAALAISAFGPRLRRLAGRARLGLAILGHPRAYLSGVAAPQIGGWFCRIGAAWAMLAAFHVHASPANALLVLVVCSASTLVPVTPGGAGAQQALMALALAGAASPSAIMAFAVGAQAVATAVSIGVGMIALYALFGGVRWSSVLEQLRLADEPAVLAAAPSAGVTGS